MYVYPMKTPLWVDTTLRDGIQAPGISLSPDQKQGIFSSLLDLGLRSIEVGIPVQGPQEKEFISWCATYPEVETIAWNRLKEEDVEASLDCGVTTLHLAVPAGQAYRESLGHLTNAQILKTAERLLSIIIKNNKKATLGVEDAPHCDPGFLKELFMTAQHAGAFRVRLADSLGSLSPSQTHSLISPLTEVLTIPMEFHGHNDLGMATANAFSAWEAGAQAISTTIGGLGERGGHTALEEVAAAVEIISGSPSGIHWKNLETCASRIFQILNKPIPPHKPLLGEKIFEHEAGMHVDLLHRGKEVSCVHPDFLGRNHHITLSPQAGRRVLEYFARLWGHTLNPKELATLLKRWKSTWQHRDFTPTATPEDLLKSLLEHLHA